MFMLTHVESPVNHRADPPRPKTAKGGMTQFHSSISVIPSSGLNPLGQDQ